MKEYWTIPEKSGILREKHSKGLVAIDPIILEREAIRQRKKLEKEETNNAINNINQRLDRLEALLEKIANK